MFSQAQVAKCDAQNPHVKNSMIVIPVWGGRNTQLYGTPGPTPSSISLVPYKQEILTPKHLKSDT